MKLSGASLIVGGGAATSAAGANHIDATVSIDNIGASAYEVSNVTGTGINVSTGVENPTLTVTETGTRVRFENGGFPNHPLEFRDESGTVLLSQSTTGSFGDDSAVNWVDNGDAIAFTITSDLASSLAEYRCTIHINAMVGDVSVDAPVVDYTPETGSVSFTSPSDGATVTTPVSFEMAAENFTVEAASNGVRDGAGHLHILVDQPAIEPGTVIPNNESNGYYHYGDGSTTAEISLEPGTHTVRVQAGDAKHRAYDLTDTIQVTAEDPDGVTLENANLDPSSVSANATNDHTLTFDALNVSDNGNTDTFTVTIPDAAALESANSVNVVDADGDNVSLSGGPDTSGNQITFDVAPDSSADTRDLTVTADVTVTAPNVSNTTEADITANVTDSDNGQDNAAVTLTIEPEGGGSDLAPYLNDEDIVDAGGLQDAAADFRSGDIDPTVLQDAAAAFRSGGPQI